MPLLDRNTRRSGGMILSETEQQNHHRRNSRRLSSESLLSIEGTLSVETEHQSHVRRNSRRLSSESVLSIGESSQSSESPDETALWDGIFWLEACMAIAKPVEWLKLNTVMDGVREEAFKAGVFIAAANPRRRAS